MLATTRLGSSSGSAVLVTVVLGSDARWYGRDAQRRDGGEAVQLSRWLGGFEVEVVGMGWHGDKAASIFWLLVLIFFLVHKGYVMNG